jgi:hypothetical protein
MAGKAVSSLMGDEVGAYMSFWVHESAEESKCSKGFFAALTIAYIRGCQCSLSRMCCERAENIPEGIGIHMKGCIAKVPKICKYAFEWMNMP